MGMNLACWGNSRDDPGAAVWEWKAGRQGGEGEDEGVGRSQSPGRSGFILFTVTEVPSESNPGWMGCRGWSPKLGAQRGGRPQWQRCGKGRAGSPGRATHSASAGFRRASQGR